MTALTIDQRIAGTMSLPGFWDGGYSTRVALHRQDQCPITEHGIVITAEIAAGLRQRRPLHRIPAYQAWRRLGDQFADLRAVRRAA